MITSLDSYRNCQSPSLGQSLSNYIIVGTTHCRACRERFCPIDFEKRPLIPGSVSGLLNHISLRSLNVDGAQDVTPLLQEICSEHALVDENQVSN